MTNQETAPGAGSWGKAVPVPASCPICGLSHGGTPDLHDYHRGAGTWARTVEGIRLLRERGFHIRTGTTETLHTRRRLRELADFLTSIGIPPEDQIVRPLARRGASQQGAVLERADLVPELTVDVDGVYWHPVGPGEDLRLSTTIFPLREVAALAERHFRDARGHGHGPNHRRAL